MAKPVAVSARGRVVVDDRVVMMVSAASVLGGGERSMLALAEMLPSHGWNPVVVCPPGGLADAAGSAGIAVRTIDLVPTRRASSRERGRKAYPVGAVARRLGATTVNAARLARAATLIKPSVIHSNSLPSHLPTALAGRLVRRPVLWHLREIIEPGPGRAFFSRFGVLVSGMISISEAVAASVSHRNLHVVYNPVAATAAPPGPPPWGPIPRPLVGYLGRLDPRKGIEDLIDAMAELDAHAVVVGRATADGRPYAERLEARAERTVPGRVHFVGHVDDPWRALAAIDVLAVPSLAEPFGRVAVEGQLAGVPVVAADAAGLREIITDGQDGLLVPPGSPQRLAQALRLVLSDTSLRDRIVAAGKHGAQRFDPHAHAAAMAQIFDEHARGATGGRGGRQPAGLRGTPSADRSARLPSSR